MQNLGSALALGRSWKKNFCVFKNAEAQKKRLWNQTLVHFLVTNDITSFNTLDWNESLSKWHSRWLLIIIITYKKKCCVLFLVVIIIFVFQYLTLYYKSYPNCHFWLHLILCRESKFQSKFQQWLRFQWLPQERCNNNV